MNRTRQKASRAKTVLIVTFGFALILNLVEALWDPDGQPWLVLRITVSVLFGVSLVAFIALWLAQRRHEPTG